MSRCSLSVAILLLLCVLTAQAQARQDTLYMSVLNSHKHRIGALDNPTVGLFLSTDAGSTWQHRGWTGYIRVFYTEAGTDGVLWSACGNGVLRSTDDGATWRITTGWEITEVLKVKVDPLKPSVIYAATAYGVFRTGDSGEHWQEGNHGFRKPFISDLVIDRSSPDLLLAGSEEGVYRSTNAGSSWQLTGLSGKGIRTIVQHPTRKDLFFAGTEDDGVFLSNDGGRTWKQSNTGLNCLTVYTVACDRRNADLVYVGTHGGGVYRSSDGGRSWQQKTNGLDNQVVHSLLLLPSNSLILFAGTLNGGLFKSTDGGEHWSFNSQEEGQVWGLWAR